MLREIVAAISIASMILLCEILPTLVASIAPLTVFLPSHPQFTSIALDPMLDDPGKDMSLSEPQHPHQYTRDNLPSGLTSH